MKIDGYLLNFVEYEYWYERILNINKTCLIFISLISWVWSLYCFKNIKCVDCLQDVNQMHFNKPTLYINMNSHQFNLSGFNFNTAVYSHRTLDELMYSSKRNLLDLAVLINRIFEHHSRVLVVRIDLKYKKEFCDEVLLEVAQMHREKLFSDRRNYPEVFEGMVGYAWGLEYGERGGGYHYHLLALYNGALRRDDIGIGMKIDAVWDTITAGTGQCYISNFDKDKMAMRGNLGVGMIHRDNYLLRINLLEKVAAYITKKCTAFEIKSERTSSGDFRTFGRSRMPKPIDPNIPRLGRPPAQNTISW
ncbi:MAG: inovirus-type Gp2 protein [Rhodoferax sp.]|nr:inovirus-type Gp2 protein [Rhodoferax sp.]